MLLCHQGLHENDVLHENDIQRFSAANGPEPKLPKILDASKLHRRIKKI